MRLQRPKLPASPIHHKLWRFSDAIIEFAPDARGVYALWKNAQVIYYGCADADEATIRSRLLEHRSGARVGCTREATHYSWELAEAARLREDELLADFWSAFGRFPSCNEAETVDAVVKKITA